MYNSLMRLSRLFKYPVKSTRGIELQELELGDRGPVGDRRWMLVDPENEFLTQRVLPRMALIEVQEEDGGLCCHAPGMPALAVPIPTNGAGNPDAPARVQATVWRDSVEVIPASSEAAEWFSSFLKQPCRLVYQPDDSIRPVDPEYSRPGDRVSLADGYPLLLIGQGSLDLLNEKLETPVQMERFRPNLVVEGAEPHEEDTWLRIQIGKIEFELVKLCARCSIPAIDPLTAEVGPEPTRTLATYRRTGKHIMFGKNVIHRCPGPIQVGNEVTVLETD
jgi:uncharacterized protein